MKSTIVISMDMDWAPDAVIADSLELLAAHNIQATLFMTNRTSVVENTEHELGIHPYFKTLDLEMYLRERLEEFPQAKGTRSHSLFDTYQLQPIYEKLKLEYQSNVIMHQQHDIHPYHVSRTMVELPIYYMDNIYVLMQTGIPSFRLAEGSIDQPGLKVFDFHPIHVFLNMERIERYETAKMHYHDPQELLTYRNTKTRGTRDLLIDLLKYIKSCRLQVKTLGEIAQGKLKRKI